MTENRNAAEGTDPATLRHVPPSLFDGPGTVSPPTPATPFTPPYADLIDVPDAPRPDPERAAAPVVPTTVAPSADGWTTEASVAGATPDEQATFASPRGSAAPRTTASAASALRRWGAPMALVAAGLVGGLAVSTAVTNADASSTAPAPSVPGGGQHSFDRASGDDRSSGPGVTIDQLGPDAQGRGDDGSADDASGDGGRGGGYRLSDGFSLRDAAPSTQGSTGASR